MKGTVVYVFSLALAIAVRAQTLQPKVTATVAAPISTEDVVRNLVQRNQERAEALREFRGTRVYELQYHGFPSDEEAKLTVRVEYRFPEKKEFAVVSQSGSSFIISHVLKKLLEAEQESANQENRQRTALTPENYDFQMAEYERTPAGDSYVLRVTPKSRNKFLYRGEIWVDAKDFAVTRIEGEPAKSPSWWIKRTEVEHTYAKQGDFWLPAENHTVSFIRLGGRAVLTIEYVHYSINHASAEGSGAAGDPASKAAQKAVDQPQ
jgi:outer membrane lipoprotein-sorting protein